MRASVRCPDGDFNLPMDRHKYLLEDDYEEDFGFPAPGQSFFIGVYLTL